MAGQTNTGTKGTRSSDTGDKANSHGAPNASVGGGGGGGGVCFAFQKGSCTRGAGCRFSHDGGDAPALLTPAPQKTPGAVLSGACFAFQKGHCDRGDSCRFTHDASGGSGHDLLFSGRVGVGDDASGAGSTKQGSHGIDEGEEGGAQHNFGLAWPAQATGGGGSDSSEGGRGGGTSTGKFPQAVIKPNVKAKARARARAKPCAFFQRGKCTKGTKCRFSHDAEPTPGSTPGAEPAGKGKGRGKGNSRTEGKSAGKGEGSTGAQGGSSPAGEAEDAEGDWGNSRGYDAPPHVAAAPHTHTNRGSSPPSAPATTAANGAAADPFLAYALELSAADHAAEHAPTAPAPRVGIGMAGDSHDGGHDDGNGQEGDNAYAHGLDDGGLRGDAAAVGEEDDGLAIALLRSMATFKEEADRRA